MSIHVALHHVTHYEYDRPVQLGPQVIRLRPAPHSRSRILSYSLKVEPEEHFINWQQDAFANYQARLVFPKMTTAFKVTVDVVTEMAVFNPFDFFLEPSAEEVPFKYSDTVKEELQSYLDKDNKTPLFKKYLASMDRKRQRTKPAKPDPNHGPTSVTTWPSLPDSRPAGPLHALSLHGSLPDLAG